MARLRAEIVELQLANQKLEEANALLQSANDELERQVADLTDQVQQLSSENSILQGQVTTLEAHNQYLEQQNESLEVANALLNDENEKLKADNASLVDEVFDLTAELASANKVIKAGLNAITDGLTDMKNSFWQPNGDSPTVGSGHHLGAPVRYGIYLKSRSPATWVQHEDGDPLTTPWLPETPQWMNSDWELSHVTFADPILASSWGTVTQTHTGNFATRYILQNPVQQYFKTKAIILKVQSLLSD